ncbi:hypothetical protein PtA15_7A608 [Puccinia triticina]|uniref:Uncharacterized protein n=1 Tax=Puccinia triticina TaxID=208348 RepID=A0ABY7CNQ0_9BASI|nr:uncharacterized protein PtA15_7A608 [Puccinia triticina]WAQ86879.1 hypothetical protein PtA15_7A608 [Puccinia triticina]
MNYGHLPTLKESMISYNSSRITGIIQQFEVNFLNIYLPLMKICRVLVNKLLSSASSDPLVAFYEDMKQLNDLFLETQKMEDSLQRLTILVLKLRIESATNQAHQLLGWVKVLFERIESRLNLPYSRGTNQTQIERACEWCQMCQDQYEKALENFWAHEPVETEDQEEDWNSDDPNF